MRTFLLGLSGSLYALFNTGVYVDSALQDAGSFGLVSKDYQDLFNTTGGICFTVAVLALNTTLFLSLANTYVKKSIRHYAGREVNFLPASLASVVASIGAVAKSVTSNASTALTIAFIILDCMSDSERTSKNEMIAKVVSFAAFNVLALSSTYLINYAIGFNEAQSNSHGVELSSCNKKFLSVLTRIVRPSIHAVISNTPSNLMYVLEGHHFVKFVARFITGSSEDAYQLPAWLAAVSYTLNALLVLSMEFGYNVRYDQEIRQLEKHLHGDDDYHQLGDGSATKKNCCLQIENKQRRLVESNPRLIMGTSSLYKSLIMTFSAFMLVYKLSSKKNDFDAGHIQLTPAIAAGAVGLVNLVVCVVAVQAFLFEKKRIDTLPVDRPIADDAVQHSPRS